MTCSGVGSAMLVTEPLVPASARALASSSRLTVLGGAGERDEPVALDRGLAGDGLLGFADLLVDALEGPAGPIVFVPGSSAPGLCAGPSIWPATAERTPARPGSARPDAPAAIG
jgi:hypothetical protein